jgi:pseudouridine-5'-phosphate glycosidase
MGRAREALGIDSALLVCNPIPVEDGLGAEETAAAVADCIRRARTEHVTGKMITPFLLSCVAERTGGRSVDANVALLRANAELAGLVAAALAPAS